MKTNDEIDRLVAEKVFKLKILGIAKCRNDDAGWMITEYGDHDKAVYLRYEPSVEEMTYSDMTLD